MLMEVDVSIYHISVNGHGYIHIHILGHYYMLFSLLFLPFSLKMIYRL